MSRTWTQCKNRNFPYALQLDCRCFMEHIRSWYWTFGWIEFNMQSTQNIDADKKALSNKPTNERQEERWTKRHCRIKKLTKKENFINYEVPPKSVDSCLLIRMELNNVVRKKLYSLSFKRLSKAFYFRKLFSIAQWKGLLFIDATFFNGYRQFVEAFPSFASFAQQWDGKLININLILCNHLY